MMKSGAERTSNTPAATATQSARKSFIPRHAGDDSFIAPTRPGPAVQAKMEVNKPGDKFEQEADRTANKITRMPEEKAQKAPAPEEKVQKKEEEKIQKAAMPEEKVQKAPVPEEKVQKKEEEKIQKAAAPE